VVWLNVRPRVEYCRVEYPEVEGWGNIDKDFWYVRYGYPFTLSVSALFDAPLPYLLRFSPEAEYEEDPCDDEVGWPRWAWPLAANIAIGLLAVAVLTFASEYLLRRTVSGVRAVFGKPPPGNAKGPERAS
jgi:hypothetical protein